MMSDVCSLSRHDFGTNPVRRFTGFAALRSSSYNVPNQFSFATNRKSFHNEEYRILNNIRHKKVKTQIQRQISTLPFRIDGLNIYQPPYGLPYERGLDSMLFTLHVSGKIVDYCKCIFFRDVQALA